MYNKDIEAKIASNDEFGNGDTKSTPLIITIGRKLRSCVEIGTNTTHNGGPLMLPTTIVSLSKMIRLEIFTILTSQETMTLWVDG
jgi:hypothetical protein